MTDIDKKMVVAALLTIATAIFRLEHNSTEKAIESTEKVFDNFAP